MSLTSIKDTLVLSLGTVGKGLPGRNNDARTKAIAKGRTRAYLYAIHLIETALQLKEEGYIELPLVDLSRIMTAAYETCSKELSSIGSEELLGKKLAYRHILSVIANDGEFRKEKVRGVRITTTGVRT